MTLLVERPATPAEIAARIDEPLNNVTYHLKVLVRLGCVDLVRVQPAAGGRVVEHVYRATRRAYLDAEAWEQLSEREKFQVSTSIMQLLSEDVAEAMSHGTFYRPDDNHLSRSPMQLDREGWEEATALLNATCDGLEEIQENVDKRAAPPGDMMHTKVHLIQFRSPTPKTESP